eukprot:TRINITY_DN1400_c1_g1_i1.p1 TRINITY_DN1400_c1_g1~~TRINITY_DN1400_c1_g1_i1.p1  ORF type:complete len:221 (+),score=57.76 TRINITY_DN1400_c1_g1_i1:108-770(+)
MNYNLGFYKPPNKKRKIFHNNNNNNNNYYRNNNYNRNNRNHNNYKNKNHGYNNYYKNKNVTYPLYRKEWLMDPWKDMLILPIEEKYLINTSLNDNSNNHSNNNNNNSNSNQNFVLYKKEWLMDPWKGLEERYKKEQEELKKIKMNLSHNQTLNTNININKNTDILRSLLTKRTINETEQCGEYNDNSDNNNKEDNTTNVNDPLLQNNIDLLQQLLKNNLN